MSVTGRATLIGVWQQEHIGYCYAAATCHAAIPWLSVYSHHSCAQAHPLRDHRSRNEINIFFCSASIHQAPIVNVSDGKLMTAGGLITGDMRVNGFPKVQATFARICG